MALSNGRRTLAHLGIRRKSTAASPLASGAFPEACELVESAQRIIIDAVPTKLTMAVTTVPLT